MRDLPANVDLLALARELLLDELAPLLPLERRREAHLVATVMAIASREASGGGWQEEIWAALADFYGAAAPHPNPLPACGEKETPTPTLPRLRGRGFVSGGSIDSAPDDTPNNPQADNSPPSPASGGGRGWGFDDALLGRFAADLRNGAFETNPSRAAAARAILWRLTIEKLREGNPHFLAANGFARAGRQGT